MKPSLGLMGHLALIMASLKHQQKALSMATGSASFFPYHSHKTKTFKANQRKERKAGRIARAR